MRNVEKSLLSICMIVCTVELISGQMADCNRGVGTNRLRDDQFEPTVLQLYEPTSVSRPNIRSRDQALLEQ